MTKAEYAEYEAERNRLNFPATLAIRHVNDLPGAY